MTGAPTRIPVVAAVLEREGRYLVCRRPDHKRHGGLWEFPGGKVLEGEARTDAVRRELAEELELDVTEVGDVVFSAADEDAPFVIEFVAARASGTPVLHEHTEVGWFYPHELGGLPLAPSDACFARWLSARPEPA